LIIIKSLKKNKTENINSQEKINKNSPLILRIISLGGMPPSVGFFPKIIIIFLLIKRLKKILLVSFFLLSSSIIRIISYLRLLIKTMTKSKKKSKFKILKSNLIIHKTQIIFIPIIILILPI
jgi:NADH:ubiquinone oxidoreductase subunit 2 (subunit N)